MQKQIADRLFLKSQQAGKAVPGSDKNYRNYARKP
jgi:hypothetical protein